MANTDKDILITPNRGQTTLPEMKFVGSGNTPLYLKVLDDNTITFESNTNQLFSITSNLTSDQIFSVNNISGIPSISVEATGEVRLNQFAGFTQIGGKFDSLLGSYKLDIVGSLRVSGKLVSQNGTTADWDSTEIYSDGVQSNYNARGAEFGFAFRFDGTERIRIHQTGKIALGNLNRSITTDSKLTTLNVRGGGYGNMGTATAAIRILAGGGSGLGGNRVNNYNSGIAFQHLDPTNSTWGETYSGNQAWIGLRVFDTPGQERSYLVFGTNSGTSAGTEPTSRVSLSPFGDVYVGDDHHAPQGGNPGSVSGYKVSIQGNVNVTSGDYYKDGDPLTPLPEQTDETRGAYLVSDGPNGAFWSYPGATVSSAPLSGYRYRSILTHGYIGGGYKGSQPWRSLNKTWHTTDTTFYCGEQLDRAASYCDGTWSDYNAYVHGTVNAYQGNSSHTSSYNLNTGIKRVQGDSRFSQYVYGYQGDNPRTVMGYGVTGGWAMSVGRNDAGCATNQIGQGGYITGGGNAATNKLHFPTEIMYTTTSSISGSDFVAGIGGETRAYFSWRDGNQQYMTYSNDAFTSQNFAGANRGWCKALGTKWGHFYIGTDDNVTRPVRKVRDSDGAALSNFNRARAAGEENMQMGQDWGYKLGDFDGQQNNHTEKWTYSNDSIATMGFATRPKGHYGQSSAACSSASASVTSTQPF